eukprot:CAMPEP_0172517424 /NCGR_PEP_ID=MMETSP1066-20121228/284923_1 /TAXON_ID=671091 /ORGANISM="Coscinodiscus wailesii, Strain CCMP2513" /LENGTH=271 /DNA_ID=CAMNT_0013299419 /DNA_START=625 /DNA_END=1437 /DNA_ORIENTATION=+
MLSKSKFIAQVDAKYIIINAGGILCAIDQHAADERVSLERLEKSLLLKEKEDNIKTERIYPAQSLSLTSAQMTILFQHEHTIKKWKFGFKISSLIGAGSNNNNNTIFLMNVPSLFSKTATSGDFLEFLIALGSCSADASIVKPPFIKRVLASHACRYAIMFGDVLSRETCVTLIDSLAMCDFSFVCAHGRPSVIPLLDMAGLDSGGGGRSHCLVDRVGCRSFPVSSSGNDTYGLSYERQSAASRWENRGDTAFDETYVPIRFQKKSYPRPK